MGETIWRTEPTPVEMLADELWLAEKFQSNSAIAGSPRNSSRTSVVERDTRRESTEWMMVPSRDTEFNQTPNAPY